jgi:hypothetical protein
MKYYFKILIVNIFFIIMISTNAKTNPASDKNVDDIIATVNKNLEVWNNFQGTWSLDGHDINLELYYGGSRKKIELCFINIIDERKRQLNKIEIKPIIFIESKKIIKTRISGKDFKDDLKKANSLQILECYTNLVINIEQEPGFLNKMQKKIMGK